MTSGQWIVMGCGLTVASLVGVMPCAAQTSESYPVKNIRFVVPFAPGGGTDVLARILAPKMSERLEPVMDLYFEL